MKFKETEEEYVGHVTVQDKANFWDGAEQIFEHN